MTFQPVIIIGAPRSGTNMLRDVLTRMDQFHTWPCDEINFVWKHGNLSHRGDDLVPGQISPQTREFVHQQFQDRARESGAPYIVEKTCANSVRVPFVDALVPGAKYILLLRDGHDAVASIIKRWQAPSSSMKYLWQKFKFVAPADRVRVLADALGKRMEGFGNSKDKAWKTWGPVFPELLRALNEERLLPEVCAIQWAYCVKMSIESFETMVPEQWLPVRYEKFVTDPSNELPRVLDFLGFSCSESKVASAISEVHGASVGKAGHNIKASSLELIDAAIAEAGIDIGAVLRK